MHPLKTEAIRNFLLGRTRPDLAALYTPAMEVQVLTAQDNGERIEGEYKGRAFNKWSDGVQTWGSFRIPNNASTEPTYEDRPITFDLDAHAEGIGCTGWDWQNRVSRWVAFDFDAITGHSEKHSKKLTDEQMKEVGDLATQIPWVSVRRSTGGGGLHIYVMLPNVPTANHNEHAALARSILGKMSAITGFDFVSKVDVCGHVLWFWHRKMKVNGLTLIKQGTTLDFDSIPINWREHVAVVKGTSTKIKPSSVELPEDFEELTGQRFKTDLTEEHKALIAWFDENQKTWWWDSDHYCMVTHTYTLKQAHTALSMKGIFETLATGSDPTDHNCFAFPLRNGAWAIRRFGQGVHEHPSWEQDRAGWTRCYYNVQPNLSVAAKYLGGIENKSGAYVFTEAEVAIKAANLLGANIDIDPAMAGRKAILKETKDKRLLIEVEHNSMDRADKMAGWLVEKGQWQRIMKTKKIENAAETETANYDDAIRHIVSEIGGDRGWMIKSDNTWREEPLQHVRVAMMSFGLNLGEINQILGNTVMKAWTLTNIPFASEYPGNRRWNRNGAQLKYVPTRDKEVLEYPTWLKVLNQVGRDLDKYVLDHPWCKVNGVATGADYLKCWLASLFQEPTEPLPYLFLYGPQKSGKSIFHESLELLVSRGYMRADMALQSKGNFNKELESAIISVVEEINLQRDKSAYNKIKDWVTARQIPIHEKGETPILVTNTNHFIHCANERTACPVFSGDTRITMIYVAELDPLEMIPRKDLIKALQLEAPDFLAELFSVELSPSSDRLNVPVITTDDKASAEEANLTTVELFLKEKTYHVTGKTIKFSDVYSRYVEWVDPNDCVSKIEFGRSLPRKHPKGHDLQAGNQVYVCNISWEPFKTGDQVLPEIKVQNDRITQCQP